MSAVMSDVIDGSITPSTANAAVNAGGKLLKVVELQMKHGTIGEGTGQKDLILCPGFAPEEPPDERRQELSKLAAMRSEIDAREKELLGTGQKPVARAGVS